MTAGIRCDGPGCPAFAPGQPGGWLYVVQRPEEYSVLAAVFGTPQQPATFCSARCLANWAYLQVVSGPATGTEPKLRGGTGWPR